MADTTTKRAKSMNKKPKTKDESHLSDSDSSVVDIECMACGISFPSMESYDSHLQSKRHHKKASGAKFFAKRSASNENENDDDDDDEGSKNIHCEVCDKYISGYKSYVAHLKGSVHAKNVKKQKLKQKLGNIPEVLNKEKKEEDSDDEESLEKPYARCSTCQKEFSGPEPLNLHMQSVAHKKKVKQTQTLQNLKAKYADGTKNSDDDGFFSKCNDCQKSFSGFVPYQIHMESRAHKKNLEKGKLAEEMKGFYFNDEFVCKECKKTFTDPAAFKSHLAKNSHEKQKAKSALKEFLYSDPEIVSATPLDKDHSGGSDDDDSDSKSLLVCKLCHMSFSGPKSAQDHIKSKKHISARKEKKMLKLLKEQETRSTVESSDKSGAAQSPKSSADGISVNGTVKVPAKPENLEDFEMI